MTRGTVALAVALLFPLSAHGNIAALATAPSTLARPRALAPTPLVIAREELRIDCGESVQISGCRFEARYHVRNPTAETQSIVAAFYGEHCSSVDVRVEDRSLLRALSADERTALDAAARGALPTPSPSARPPRNATETGFDLSVGAGATVVLVARGVLDAASGDRFSGEAMQVRHPLLFRARAGRTVDLEYDVSPIRTWGSVGPITVSIRVAEGWRAHTNAGAALQGESSFSVTPERVPTLRIRLERAPGVLRHGGPYVAAGGAIGSSAPFRLRAGYEIAAPSWLVYALAVETDAVRSVLVTPSVEASLPWIFPIGWLPAFSVGVGVPVQVTPVLRAGFRAMVGAQYPVVGFTTSVDVFPAQFNGDQTSIVTSLMGRVSL